MEDFDRSLLVKAGAVVFDQNLKEHVARTALDLRECGQRRRGARGRVPLLYDFVQRGAEEQWGRPEVLPYVGRVADTQGASAGLVLEVIFSRFVRVEGNL